MGSISDRKPPKINVVELAIVALIWGGMVYVFWPILSTRWALAGDPIPKSPPNEADRFHHPSGFSIVVPPNWRVRPTTDLEPLSDSLMMAPIDPYPNARRSKAIVEVSTLDPGPDQLPEVKGFQRTKFLEREAYEKMAIIREWTFDDDGVSEYVRYCRCGNNWYVVRYTIAEERTTLPEMVRRYLDTLRCDEAHP